MKVHLFNEPTYRTKMAAFDYDWTLVCPKNEKTFPTDVNDWKFLYPNIKSKLKKYYDDGFMLVIFTNQSKEWKLEQLQIVMKELNLPIFMPLGNYKVNKDEGKPHSLIFNFFLGNNTINKEESFYVGDALGRKGDWSDTDKLFAENISVKYYSPEEIFYVKKEFELPKIELSDKKEIVIMVGYPGSGKTTIVNHICKSNNNYIAIHGDTYKTTPKMLKAAKELINQNKSIIFDATNSSIKKRKNYIEFGKKHNYLIKCIHMTTSLEESYERNKIREEDKHVPRIAYSVYKKYYEEPTDDEGFILLKY